MPAGSPSGLTVPFPMPTQAGQKLPHWALLVHRQSYSSSWRETPQSNPASETVGLPQDESEPQGEPGQKPPSQALH
jgi:hypothetical protein